MTPEEKTFETWQEKLHKLKDLSEKKGDQILLEEENETLLVNPAKLLLELRQECAAPRLGNCEWDNPISLAFFKNTGNCYRKFREQTTAQEAPPYKYQFLIYKRFNTPRIWAPIPRTNRGTPVSGLQGATEILYCPEANIPKNGRKVIYTYIDNPTFCKNSDFEERAPLVGESFCITSLVPMGTKGFFLFASEQQNEIQKVFPNENTKLAIGPTGEGTRIRASHLLRRLCHGKPEETPMAKKAIDDACAAIQKENLGKILALLEETPLKEKSNQELQEIQREFELSPKERRGKTLFHHLKIDICPNTINTQNGEDYAISLDFGNVNTHEAVNESNLIDLWKLLIQK